MSTNPSERDIDNARELIDAIRKGIGVSDLKGLITLQEWTVAGQPAAAASAVEQLREAADLYASASEDRDSAMEDLKRRIRECGEAGVPKRTIAQLARVSPQTVYDAIKGGQP
jgi:hypothetical protein